MNGIVGVRSGKHEDLLLSAGQVGEVGVVEIGRSDDVVVENIGSRSVGDGAIDDVVQQDRLDGLGRECLEIWEDLVDGSIGGSEECLVGRAGQVGQLKKAKGQYIF